MEVFVREHPWYTVLPLTAILAYLLTLTGLWQLVFAAGVLAGVLHKRPTRSFALGLVAGVLAWGIPLGLSALFFPLVGASGVLVDILGLPSSMTFLPFVLTILISGLTTALGALVGAYAYGLASTGGRELEQAQ
ncbi:MAG: hypothetical protein ACE5EW_05945 [Thermoplasmata archaeon]